MGKDKKTYYFELKDEDLFKQSVLKLIELGYSNKSTYEKVDTYIEEEKLSAPYDNYDTYLILGVESVSKMFLFNSLSYRSSDEKHDLCRFNESIDVKSKEDIPFL